MKKMMKDPKFRDTLMLLARILIASLFIYTGYGKLSDVSGVASFYQMPSWQIALAGLVELGGGLLILLGGCVHLGAMILGTYLIVVSVMIHLPLTDDVNNTVHLLKNLSILGGLIFVMLLGGGSYQIYKCKCDQ